MTETPPPAPRDKSLLDRFNPGWAALVVASIALILAAAREIIAEKGCAKRVVALCKEAGVTLTEAGATHPYHKDPDDAYIRIAPSFPTPAELSLAMEIFCTSARLAFAEKLLG